MVVSLYLYIRNVWCAVSLH